MNTLLNTTFIRRSYWPRGQRSRSTAAGLLGLRLLIPLGAWMSDPCQCCVLSGLEVSGPKEPCRVWRVCCVISKRQQWIGLGARRADAITNKIFYWPRMTCDHKILYWLRITCHHKQDIVRTADDMWSQDTLLTADYIPSQTRYFTVCGWVAITRKIFYRTLPGKLSLRIHINTVCCNKNKIYNCDYVLKKTTNRFNEERWTVTFNDSVRTTS